MSTWTIPVEVAGKAVVYNEAFALRASESVRLKVSNTLIVHLNFFFDVTGVSKLEQTIKGEFTEINFTNASGIDESNMKPIPLGKTGSDFIFMDVYSSVSGPSGSAKRLLCVTIYLTQNANG